MAGMTMQINAQAEAAREAARHQTGRFGEQEHSAPETTLVTTESLLESRRRQLAAFGFVPAQPQLKLNDTADVEQWWKRTQSIAEAGQYETMPQRDADGKRAMLRTYAGSNTKVRMPSVTSIRRFAKQHGTTFDVPVEAVTPHGPITGHVRVTSHGGGRYSVSAVQMPKEHAEYVAESVLASLEARRPSRGLAEVRDILTRRRERLASQGVKVKPVDSGWIQGVGYNPNDQQLVMNLQGRVYGYHVEPDVYEAMMSSGSIGSAYNHLVKRVAPRFEVEQHSCGNYFYAGAEHRCPSYHHAPNFAREAAVATAAH
jgi:hypothetical protein